MTTTFFKDANYNNPAVKAGRSVTQHIALAGSNEANFVYGMSTINNPKWLRIGSDVHSKGIEFYPKEALTWRLANDGALLGASSRTRDAEAGTGGSFLQTTGSGDGLGYIENQAYLCVAKGNEIGKSIGGSFAVRRGPNEDGGSRIGLAAIGLNSYQGTNTTKIGVHAAYIEALRDNVDAGNAKGIELQVANIGTVAKFSNGTGVTPYNGNVQGTAIGIGLGSGADSAVNPNTVPADCGIGFGNNGNTFQRGIVFRHNAFESYTSALTGKAAEYVMTMASDHQMTWHGSGDVQRAAVVGRDNGFLEIWASASIQNRTGNTMFSANTGGLTIADVSGGGNTARFFFHRDGRMFAYNLPTSASGLPSGAVWRDGTQLRIVA